MTQLEDRIHRSLAQDDQEFLEELDRKPSYSSELLHMLRGPMAKTTWFAFTLIAVFTGLMIWSGWNAFNATTNRSTILWSTGFISCLIPHGFLRIWFFNRANHLMVLRELKRLELRVSLLTDK